MKSSITMLSLRIRQNWEKTSLLHLLSRQKNKIVISAVVPFVPARFSSTLVSSSITKMSSFVQQGTGCSMRIPQPQCTSRLSVRKALCNWSRHLGANVTEETCSSEPSGQNSRHGTNPLPKLPLPDLKQTMDKYLTILSTVVSQQELDTTTQHVQQFIKPGGWGHKLQQYLIKRHSETENWATDWWLHNMYLDVRLPLPVHTNPACMCPKQHFASREEYLRFASKYVQGALDYKSMVDGGTLPVEVVGKKKTPLSMEQHYRLFSSYRRPGIPSDLLLTDLGTQEPAYMVVACRNQFYKVDVEQDGVKLSENELYSQLHKVVKAAESHSTGSPPVGVLTTMDRPAWAEARDRLATDPCNLANLDIIEHSAFILCLDKPTRSSAAESDDITDQLHNIWHGQGTDHNTCNRWFDKTCQMLVAEDGVVGTNTEHAVSEAGAVNSFKRHSFFYCTSKDMKELSSSQEMRHLSDPVWLKWNVTSGLLSDIARAQHEVNKLIQNTDICFAEFDEFGHEFPKSQGISPDAFVQLAIQWAYYRLHGRMVMTYESATLRRFRKGRVDNVRANSPAALAWLQTMSREVQVSESQKLALFRAAIAWQKKYQTEAISGHGIDCHLIGLQGAATELNVLDSIPFFSDPSFHKMFEFPLSTSQAPPTLRLPTVYGATTPDGYGVPYKMFADSMILAATSFHDCPHTSSQKFMDSLVSSLLELRDLCLQKS